MPRFDISDFVADGGQPARYWYVTLGVAGILAWHFLRKRG
jgi:hypothetical protein